MIKDTLLRDRKIIKKPSTRQELNPRPQEFFSAGMCSVLCCNSCPHSSSRSLSLGLFSRSLIGRVDQKLRRFLRLGKKMTDIVFLFDSLQKNGQVELILQSRSKKQKSSLEHFNGRENELLVIVAEPFQLPFICF